MLPRLKELFVEECGSIAEINFDRMADHSLRMFTWVYLAAFDQLNPETLTLTHIERME